MGGDADLDNFSTLLHRLPRLGRGKKYFQYAAQVQYETAPFLAENSPSFIIAWAVSLGSLGLALMPGWWLMRNLDPAQLMRPHRDKVLNETFPGIYSRGFTSALERGCHVTVKVRCVTSTTFFAHGSSSRVPRN